MDFIWQSDGDDNMVIYDYKLTLELSKKIQTPGKFSDNKISYSSERIPFKGHFRSLSFGETNAGKQGARSTHRVYTRFEEISNGDRIYYEEKAYTVIYVDKKVHHHTDDYAYQVDLEVFE